MIEGFHYSVAGFGDSYEEALKDAESRLPRLRSERDFYDGEPQILKFSVRSGVKVEISYNLLSEKDRTKKDIRKKCGSAGSIDPFACTRGLISKLD